MKLTSVCRLEGLDTVDLAILPESRSAEFKDNSKHISWLHLMILVLNTH